MYTTYFGFHQIPFNTDSQPEDYFYGSSARQVADELTRAISGSTPLMMFTGDKGTGKSALIRSVAYSLNDSCQFIFPQRYIDSFAEFVGLIHATVCPPGQPREVPSVSQMQEDIERRLHNPETPEDSWVLVVDDIDNISPDVIRELIRYFLKSGNPALRIVLIGGPSMTSMVNEWITDCDGGSACARVHLDNFQIEEIRWFIDHRLSLAGYDGPPLFTQDAIRRIAEYTKGNPGLISALCGFSLLNVSIENRQQVCAEVIDEEAKHCIFKPEPVSDGVDPVVETDATILLPGTSAPGFDRTTDTLGAKTPFEFKQSQHAIDRDPDSAVTTDDTVERKGLNAAISGLEERYQELGLQMPESVDADAAAQGLSGEAEGFGNSPAGAAGETSDWLAAVKRYLRDANLVYGAMSMILIAALTAVAILIMEPAEPNPSLAQQSSEGQMPAPQEHHDDTVPAVHSVAHKASLETADVIETPVDEKGARIRAMLERAESQISSRELIGETSENALETYREISRLVNRQMEALNDLIHMRQLYQRWGLEAEIQKNWKEAEIFYSQALKISPQNPRLLEAMNRVQNHLLAKAPEVSAGL